MLLNTKTVKNVLSTVPVKASLLKMIIYIAN